MPTTGMLGIILASMLASIYIYIYHVSLHVRDVRHVLVRHVLVRHASLALHAPPKAKLWPEYGEIA